MLAKKKHLNLVIDTEITNSSQKLTDVIQNCSYDSDNSNFAKIRLQSEKPIIWNLLRRYTKRIRGKKISQFIDLFVRYLLFESSFSVAGQGRSLIPSLAQQQIELAISFMNANASEKLYKFKDYHFSILDERDDWLREILNKSNFSQREQDYLWQIIAVYWLSIDSNIAENLI